MTLQSAPCPPTVSLTVIRNDEIALRTDQPSNTDQHAALEPTSMLSLSFGGRRTCSPDRVGRSTKLVGGDMSHHPCLTGSISRVPSGPAQHSCRSHGMAPRRAGLRHPDLASRPCSNLLNGLAGP
jgi:hypothetical protein